MKPIDQLSPRQQQVIEQIAHGKSDKEIACDLELSEDTVKAHLNVLFVKLKARSRAHAVFLVFGRK